MIHNWIRCPYCDSHLKAMDWSIDHEHIEFECNTCESSVKAHIGEMKEMYQ